MKGLTVVWCASATALLAGCMTPWPIEPMYDRAKLEARRKDMPQVDIDATKRIAFAWHEDLADAARDRRKQEIAASEVLFYGTLLFSAAQASLTQGFSTTALYARNLGATAAAGSQLAVGHYQFKDQRAAFRKAEIQMGCLVDALEPVPSLQEWQQGFDAATITEVNKPLASSNRDIVSLYNSVPRLALHFIERTVIPRLQADLQEISLGTPSREDIVAAADRYKSDAQVATKAAQAIPTAASGAQPATPVTAAEITEVVKQQNLTPEQANQAKTALSTVVTSATTKGQDQTGGSDSLALAFVKALPESIGQPLAKKIQRALEEKAKEKRIADDARTLLRKQGAVEAITTFSSTLALCQPS